LPAVAPPLLPWVFGSVESSDTEERWIGIASVVFFWFLYAFAVARLVQPTPALVIHPSGIFDNASALSAGFLLWDEIAGVYVAKLKNQRFLANRGQRRGSPIEPPIQT
jgi:hypothetical protein